MSNAWFETVAEAQRRAKKRLPKSVYGALVAGSEKGLTLADNQAAFGELGFAPHVAGLSAKRDLSTTVMGQAISLPVIISPTGVQAVHPDGEVAVARAAAARGTAVGLSSYASKPVEEVVQANPQTFFQLYWSGTREQIRQRIERAKAAGAVGLIVTLDWSFSQGRDWGSPAIPEKIDLKAMIRYAPEALTHPKWLAAFAKTRKIPDLTVPNLTDPGQPAPTFFGVYGEWMQTPPPTWEDVAWLVKEWGGHLMLKGITQGRRRLAGRRRRASPRSRCPTTAATTSTARRHRSGHCPRSSTPSATEIEIVLDGGVRRGSDVVKAVALGARAVMIGRAYLWGLAANGQAGVENVLDILRGGIDSRPARARPLHHSRPDPRRPGHSPRIRPRPGCSPLTLVGRWTRGESGGRRVG